MSYEEKKPVDFELHSPTGVAKDSTVKLAGRDISRYVRAVTLHAHVGDLHKVNVEVMAYDGVDVVLPAEVTVVFQVLQPGEMSQETLPDGSRRFTYRGR